MVEGIQFLQDYIISVIIFPSANNTTILNENVWYQQNVIPPHYATDITRYLEEVFPIRCIGRRCSIEWLPRFSDRNKLDLFLCGHLKMS